MTPKSTNRVVLFLIAGVLLFTCDNYEFPSSPYPRVETLPVIDIVDTGVTFQADVPYLGNARIIDHGFVWGFDENLSIRSEDKIQLGELSTKGVFNTPVSYGLYSDTTYFVKAYVATEDYFVYGKVQSFRSKGSEPPVISNFSPNEGTWGDTVLLKGKYFSTVNKYNNVKFGSFNSLVISSTDSTIYCVVPNDIPSKTVSIYLSVSGKQTKSITDFTLVTPGVISFYPETGTFDDIVTIEGENFSIKNQQNVVTFNSYIAEVIESTESSLRVKVPRAIRQKENVISVTVNLQSGSSSSTFSIVPPVISSVSTYNDFIGSTIQIVGDNFNPSSIGNSVLFGERIGIIQSASKNLLTVTVPDGIYKNRSFPIEVKVAEQSAFSEIFTLQDAWIRKADIPSGKYGRYLSASFELNKDGYIGLGSTEDNKFWRYDPLENSWSEVAPFPGGSREKPISFVIGSNAYVGWGSNTENGIQQNDLWKYDVNTGIWTELQKPPFESSPPNVALSIFDKGYILTLNEFNNFWEYSPELDSWNIMSDDFPAKYHGYGAPVIGFTIDDDIYIYCSDGASTGPNPFYKYTFTNWEELEYLDTYIIYSGEIGFSLHDKGYVMDESHLNKYDPITNSWSSIIGGPSWRRLFCIYFVIDNKVYIGGGFSGSTELWEYDPDYE